MSIRCPAPLPVVLDRTVAHFWIWVVVAKLSGGDPGGAPLLFDELAATSEAVAALSQRNDKVATFTQVLMRTNSSTRYPGGITLRFARVAGYRHDKLAANADRIATVQALLR